VEVLNCQRILKDLKNIGNSGGEGRRGVNDSDIDIRKAWGWSNFGIPKARGG